MWRDASGSVGWDKRVGKPVLIYAWWGKGERTFLSVAGCMGCGGRESCEVGRGGRSLVPLLYELRRTRKRHATGG